MRSLLPSYMIIVLALIGAIPMGVMIAFGVLFNWTYFIGTIVYAITFYIANIVTSRYLKERYYDGKWKGYDDIFGD